MKRYALAIVVGALVVVFARNSFAHCDTIDGPVVMDAQAALQKKDVTPVLKWVKKDAEPEIRTAFKKALAERKKDAETSDTRFFETLLRVHRAGEGAPFTGIKPAGTVEPVIALADSVLETGSADALVQKMSAHLTSKVQERFDRAAALRKLKDSSVEAGREYVEAYVRYIHFVESIHAALDADGDLGEKHGTTAGHEGHRDAQTPRAHPAAGVHNIFENIPYQEQGMGTRKLVDNKNVMMMQIALKPGQSVPQHMANSNVNLLVVKGEVVINLNGVEHIAGEGSLVPVAYKTPMSITNRSHGDATFLNIKTPSPSEMKDEAVER